MNIPPIASTPVHPIREILEEASRLFGYKPDTITGKRRDAPIMEVRKTVCFVAVSAGHSRAAVGRAMGYKDHSTVIHHVNAFPYVERSFSESKRLIVRELLTRFSGLVVK